MISQVSLDILMHIATMDSSSVNAIVRTCRYLYNNRDIIIRAHVSANLDNETFIRIGGKLYKHCIGIQGVHLSVNNSLRGLVLDVLAFFGVYSKNIKEFNWFHGNKIWRADGGPAITGHYNDVTMYCIWTNPRGQLHRSDSPACEFSNGIKIWYTHDRAGKISEVPLKTDPHIEIPAAIYTAALNVPVPKACTLSVRDCEELFGYREYLFISQSTDVFDTRMRFIKHSSTPSLQFASHVV